MSEEATSPKPVPSGDAPVVPQMRGRTCDKLGWRMSEWSIGSDERKCLAPSGDQNIIMACTCQCWHGHVGRLGRSGAFWEPWSQQSHFRGWGGWETSA